MHQNSEILVEKLTYNQRLELVKILNYEIMIDNKITNITTAINFMVKSFVTALNLQLPFKLQLPTLLEKY